jgi:hypothetical protein
MVLRSYLPSVEFGDPQRKLCLSRVYCGLEFDDRRL